MMTGLTVWTVRESRNTRDQFAISLGDLSCISKITGTWDITSVDGVSNHHIQAVFG
jgi:hypothetical protein